MTAPPLRFDLGGIGRGGTRLTVNIHENADVLQDFLDLDAYCSDGSVEEFHLSHSLEHVPSPRYREFLSDLKRKLRPGGSVRVVQTDVKRSLELYTNGELSFRALRTVIFPPADRLRRNPYNQHFNMWGPEELVADFLSAGFASAHAFDAGAWQLDTSDELHPGAVEQYHSVMIPNLGVIAMAAELPAAASSIEIAPDDDHPRIPKIIHQTWKTAQTSPPFPPQWPASWREMNPDWDYRLWTDEDIDDFIRNRHVDFYPVFRSYDSQIKRVDAFRYLLLQSKGGVYADMDFMCLKPLDALLRDRFLVFGCQDVNDSPARDGTVCNAFMASVPGHPFWDGIKADLAAHARDDVLCATGPEFLTDRVRRSRAFLEAPLSPQVVDHRLLYPFAWDDVIKIEARTLSREELAARYPSAFAVTFWTASWKHPGD